MEIVAVIAVQSGLAAALAWWLAHDLLGNPSPVFAPSAAVGTIVAAVGQRARRTAVLLAGVGLGIAVGDGLIFLIGTGPWQTGVVVCLAVGLALGIAGGSGTLVSQVAGTAVLIATLSPSDRNLELPRIVDAVVGSLVGLVVVALLLPLNPIRVLNRAADPVVHALSDHLRAIAAALRAHDGDQAQHALDGLRAMEPDVQRLREALSGAQEVVTIAPARWNRRTEFERYARAITCMYWVIDDSQDLARRAAILVRHRERLPACLPDAVEILADAVRQLQQDCPRGRSLDAARHRAIRAAEAAGQAGREGVGAYGNAVVTQVRVAGGDLLRATGCSSDEAARLIRAAARLSESDDLTDQRHNRSARPGSP
ncbi:FUSC family protein [Micromonospora sp. URMC 106]|uniref:FUSC family protein n=1 Tax=Micromonospora sp. URMC 106 TaxID=3423408 RepID=UPI003F1C4368